ncbi:hypothetical protein SMICM304S_01748 [Streptomyces microflavus]
MSGPGSDVDGVAQDPATALGEVAVRPVSEDRQDVLESSASPRWRASVAAVALASGQAAETLAHPDTGGIG